MLRIIIPFLLPFFTIACGTSNNESMVKDTQKYQQLDNIAESKNETIFCETSRGNLIGIGSTVKTLQRAKDSKSQKISKKVCTKGPDGKAILVSACVNPEDGKNLLVGHKVILFDFESHSMIAKCIENGDSPFVTRYRVEKK